ncbi:MAG: phasin family protein [Rhodobacteraceae bacterium]|nr:phasin family protein [Paracoccaceae bacterium]
MAAAKKTTNKAEDMIAEAQKSFEANAEKFGKGFEGVNVFGKETMDAITQSTEIATKAVEELNADIAAFSKKSFDDSVAAAKDLATAKTPTEMFEKQAAFATSAFEGFMAQAAKWNEAMTAATKEASAPMAERANAAKDLAKTYSA